MDRAPQGSKSQLLGHQIEEMWLSSGPCEVARLGTSLGASSAAWRAQWGTPPDPVSCTCQDIRRVTSTATHHLVKVTRLEH